MSDKQQKEVTEIFRWIISKATSPIEVDRLARKGIRLMSTLADTGTPEIGKKCRGIDNKSECFPDCPNRTDCADLPKEETNDGVYCRTCGGAGTVGSGPEPEDYGPCPDCSGWQEETPQDEAAMSEALQNWADDDGEYSDETLEVFKDAWTACSKHRDEEVRRLREALKEIHTILGDAHGYSDGGECGCEFTGGTGEGCF